MIQTDSVTLRHMTRGQDWVAVKDALRARRISMGYPNRKKFLDAKDVGAGLRRIIEDLETARRKNYDADTIIRVENVYEWQSGSIDQVLNGGEPMLLKEVRVANDLPARDAASDLRRRLHSIIDAFPETDLDGVWRELAKKLAQED